MDHLLLFLPHIFPKLFLQLQSLQSLLHSKPLKKLITPEHVSLNGLVLSGNQIMIYLHLLELTTIWIMHEVEPVGPRSSKSASQYLVSLLVFKDHMQIFFLLPVFHLIINHFRWPDQITINNQISLGHFVIVRSYESFAAFFLRPRRPNGGVTAKLLPF